MREILFRGKRIDNLEWEIGMYAVQRSLISEDKKYIIEEKTGLLIPVFPESVGQYTGLEDIKGNKIFEGDIVLLKKGIDYQSDNKDIFKPLVVVYCTDFSEYEVLRPIDISSPDKNHWVYEGVPACVGDVEEVIGNIHDNPELLEVSE